MRRALLVLLFALPCLAQETGTPRLPVNDAIRIREFYRLPSSLLDGIWPGWSKVPAPLLLVTPETEFLMKVAPPANSTKGDAAKSEWVKLADDPHAIDLHANDLHLGDLYARPRQFPPAIQATFPLFGPPAVMVVGEPANTGSKTSTPWLFTVMHEHFHQLQWAQPGYMDAVNHLRLDRGDNSGMWMLNYAFPYDKPEVAHAFAELRDSLLRTVNERDPSAFKKLARQYLEQRKNFFAQLSADDHKYFSFQLWQEGVARYTEVKAASAAADYRPTSEYEGLSDYEPFSAYAARVRTKTLDELKQADLATGHRLVVYSFGATECFLLDRINPKWKEQYFREMLSTDSYFVMTD